MNRRLLPATIQSRPRVIGWLAGLVILFADFIPLGLLAKPLVGADGALLVALTAGPVCALIGGWVIGRSVAKVLAGAAGHEHASPQWIPAKPGVLSPDGCWIWDGVHWLARDADGHFTRRRDLAARYRTWFAVTAAAAVLVGSASLIRAANEEKAERAIAASIVTAGCTVTIRPDSGAPATGFHVDLCPSIPVGTAVSVVYDGNQPVKLIVGQNVVDIATSRASRDRAAGTPLLVLGFAFLLLVGAASISRLRNLPRPSLGWSGLLLLEIALPTAFGAIAAMQPLREDTLAELRGAAVGLGVGIALAGGTAMAFRSSIFRGSVAPPQSSISE